MKSTKSEKDWIAGLVVGLSLVCWGLVLSPASDQQPITICGINTANSVFNYDHASIEQYTFHLISWLGMVGAMMLPKLFAPICYLFERSLMRYRFRLIVLFVLGYVLLWMLVGTLLLKYMDWFSRPAELSWLFQVLFLVLAITWQFSPWKQRFLNLGHNHKCVHAFGWKAHRDSFKFGLEHGLWCVGSGWALMLLPFVFPSLHYVLMAAVTIMMIGEHFEHPRVPRWESRLGLKLIWILLYRLQVTLGVFCRMIRIQFKTN